MATSMTTTQLTAALAEATGGDKKAAAALPDALSGIIPKRCRRAAR